MSTCPLPYIEDPLPLLAALRPLGGAVLLHSSDRAHADARFDILSAAPERWLTQHNGVTRVHAGSCDQPCGETALAVLEGWLAQAAGDDGTGIGPFSGGVIGLAGYDLLRAFEPRSQPACSPSDFPELIAGRYRWAVISDHLLQQSWLVTEQGVEPPSIATLLRQGLPPTPALQGPTPRLDPDTSAEAYAKAFTRVAEYIRAGDCYQVNLAVRFSGPYAGDALALYARLSRQQPAPFAGFLDTPYGAVLSCSPERFLKIEDGWIETCPIKGTRPRSDDPELDRRYADELEHSSKDRAENLMIVDLLRNDLGRSCQPGSIEVPSLFGLESFGSVHHLVSRIRGRLAAGVTPLQAFARAFPGGSITGAPKVRAMQIIDELEPHARGPYCGSLFRVDGQGRMDASITIRTLLAQQGQLYCWGGGGLVSDSICREEWAEIHHKVGTLIGRKQDAF